MELVIGNKKTNLMVEPDATYPQMWRIRYKGEVSDMVNLARAKDAAISWYLKGQHRDGGLSSSEIVRWK